jgi:hypothetical protein
VHIRFQTIFLAIASFALAALAQDGSVAGHTLVNSGDPMKVGFVCENEDLAAAGMTCSDDSPCPVYLELSSVSAAGKKLSLAGNLHGPASTLYSVLMASDDDGATWKEPAGRIPGAALDQVQLFDATHGWAAGETQVPLARDPFFLITSDGGASWRQQALAEDADAGGVGAVQRFWFDSTDHGEVIVDAGRTASGGRYALYESRTGGASWTIVSKTLQMPRLRRAASVENVDYRLGSDSKTHAYVVEKREGERWTKLASFLVQVASCGSRHLPPPPPEVESDEK